MEKDVEQIGPDDLISEDAFLRECEDLDDRENDDFYDDLFIQAERLEGQRDPYREAAAYLEAGSELRAMLQT